MSKKAVGAHPANRWWVSEEGVDLSRSERRAPLRVKLKATPRDVIFDLHRSAVVVVDMQNDFCSEGGYLSRCGVDCGPARQLIEPINRITEAMRRHDVPVIWLNWAVRLDRLNMSPSMPDLHVHTAASSDEPLAPVIAGKGGWGAFEGQWGAELADGLQVKEGDVHLTKNRFSGFFDTELDSVLKNMDIRTLFFAGVAMDICVLATLQDAMFYGYDSLMMDDCVATNSPEFCVQATRYHVEQLYGFMTLSSSLLEGIEVAK